MSTQKFLSLSMIKAHFDSSNYGKLEEFLHRTMLRLANSLWVLACNCFFQLFAFILRYISRFDSDDTRADHFQEDDRVASVGETEKEDHEFVFGFRFQNSETGESVFPENCSTNQNTSKYQVISTKDVRGFIEEPKTMRFSVQELSVGSDDAPNFENGNQDPHDEDFEELNSKAEDSVFLEETEDSVENPCRDYVEENPEQRISIEFDAHGNKETDCFENNHSGLNNFHDEVDNQFQCFDSEPKTSISTEGDEELDNSQLEFPEKISNSEEISIGGEECIDLEPNFQRLDRSFQGKELGEENLQSRSGGKFEEPPNSQKKSWESSDTEDDDDDDDGFDILLKHQELIEQMKMEIKNAKSSKGLPTILEESESPKMVEDLKPLMRIDEKLERKDRLEGIQKVYKSYAEKMRKLDVLNYQTLHAISFLQLKDQIQRGPGQKSSVINSALKSLLFPNFWPSKLRRIHADPTLKSITDLHRNLEQVYVGQLCLSWEILHWQYGKARELLEENDSGGNDFDFPYHQVAGEFQQFQVLVQRFVENEPFQGPRVQNYAKNRCDLRTLLQVPAIRDDCLKDIKDSSRVEGENVVSIAMLTEIIRESMYVFWEFLHADKDEANVILKGFQATHVDLQDLSDSELLMDIKTSLQKKEKRLKEILRSGNCIVKKFQKHHESRMEGTLLFAQVELKLVSRVLNMSRLTTDQLVWCQKKLNKINFLNRKIHVEPSFLLFPF